MNIDNLPIHWGFTFQLLVFVAIALVLIQIKLGDMLDKANHRDSSRWLFTARRAVTFVKLLALCWVVVYSHQRNWQPWPPIALFLLAFNIRVLLDILVMRAEVNRSAGTISLHP